MQNRLIRRPETPVSPVSHAAVSLLENLAARAFANVRALFARKRPQLGRHVAIYFTHVLFGLSQRAAGLLFARDRTTVRYICARIENWRDDARFDRMLQALEAAALAFAAAFFPRAAGGAA